MTNKIKFKLKITGFELEMEGTKEGTAAITSQVSEALKGLISPTSFEEESNTPQTTLTEDTEVTVIASSSNGARKKSTKLSKRNGGQRVETKALDFKNDNEKYGTPTIKWTTSIKSLWVLYVVKNSLDIDGLTSHQIAETFNKHFRQAKIIRSFTVSRDLGKLKVEGNNALVGEDNTKEPNVWYITEVGEKHIQKLIAEQKVKVNGTS